jgi:hypothetical protein
VRRQALPPESFPYRRAVQIFVAFDWASIAAVFGTAIVTISPMVATLSFLALPLVVLDQGARDLDLRDLALRTWAAMLCVPLLGLFLAGRDLPLAVRVAGIGFVVVQTIGVLVLETARKFETNRRRGEIPGGGALIAGDRRFTDRVNPLLSPNDATPRTRSGPP